MTESKPKHTPGPWDTNSRKTIVRHTETGEWIADVGGRDTPEAIANATLIARAPDLLSEVDTLRAALDAACVHLERATVQLAELRGAAQSLVDATPNVIPGDMIFRPIKALRTALDRTESESDQDR